MGSSCIVCKSFSDNEATSCSFVDFFNFTRRSLDTELTVESERASAVDREHHRDGNEREDVVIDSESLMDPYGNKGDQHIDGNQGRGEAGKKTEKDKDASEKLGVGGDNAEPRRKSEGSDISGEVVEGAVRDDLLVAVDGHGEPEREPEDERTPGLKSIKRSRHRVVRSLAGSGAEPVACDQARIAKLHGDNADVDDDQMAVRHGGEVEEGLPGHDGCVSVYCGVSREASRA